MAGTAYRGGEKKGSTGRPVPLLSHFLLARAATARRQAKKKARHARKKA